MWRGILILIAVFLCFFAVGIWFLASYSIYHDKDWYKFASYITLGVGLSIVASILAGIVWLSTVY